MPTEGIATFAFGHSAPEGAAPTSLFTALNDPNRSAAIGCPPLAQAWEVNTAPDAAQIAVPRDYFSGTD